MNLPFKLSLTDSAFYGVLWNPWSATVPTSVNNAILANLSADLQERYGLLMPTRPAVLTGYCVMCDVADGDLSFGIYDTERGAFDELYHVVSTIVAGGGVSRKFAGSGLSLPISSTRVPCIKLIGSATAAVVSGDLDLMVLHDPTSSGAPVAPSVFLLEEATGASLLSESNGLPLRSE